MHKNILFSLFFIPLVSFALSTPVQLRLTASTTTVDVQWEYPQSHQKGFKIFRNEKLIATVDKDTRTFHDIKLSPHTTYKYTVKTTDDARFFTGNIKAYVPALDFNKENIYENVAGSSVVSVTNTTELHAAVKHLKSYTTIILEDNIYPKVHATFPSYVHHITIKARNKHQAKIIPLGWNDASAFILPFCQDERACVHHVNFLNLESYGAGESRNPLQIDLYNEKKKTIQAFEFLKSGSGLKYNPSFIYFKGLKMHDLLQGIYSGLHAHDWTIDDCEIYNSHLSHMWYMMGWHQAVLNSKFYNGSHDIIALRGHYPPSETYTHLAGGDTQCHGNIYVKDRKELNLLTHLLDKTDWTHRIINNDFLAWDFSTPQRSRWNNYIGIAYENYDGDPICGAENVYLPPQNIEISKNFFSNVSEHADATLHAIKIDARKGIHNAKSLESVNGIVIHNNHFISAHDNEEFITSGSAATRDTKAYQTLRNQAQRNNDIE